MYRLKRQKECILNEDKRQGAWGDKRQIRDKRRIGEI
jgi:hypothetical protein